jgi:hypothetical protein
LTDLQSSRPPSLVRNEQRKLLANALDRASTSCITVGVLAPVAALFYNISLPGVRISNGTILVGLGSRLGAAVILRLLARRTLGSLEG